jgi:hypothetical protein
MVSCFEYIKNIAQEYCLSVTWAGFFISLIPIAMNGFGQKLEITDNKGNAVSFHRLFFSISQFGANRDPRNDGRTKDTLNDCKSYFDSFFCSSIEMSATLLIILIVLTCVSIFMTFMIAGREKFSSLTEDSKIEMPKSLLSLFYVVNILLFVISNIVVWIDYVYYFNVFTTDMANYLFTNYPSITPSGGIISLPDRYWSQLFAIFHTLSTFFGLFILSIIWSEEKPNLHVPGEEGISLAQRQQV